MEESRMERIQRFTRLWWKSRAEAGKSQEFMALSLGVSKKTVQNWEKGVSSPDLFQGMEWFRILGLNPVPYYLEYLHPNHFQSHTLSSDDKKVEETLKHLIESATIEEKRQLLFLMAGAHGSSWYSLLQMFTAHCHTSMRSRVNAASLVKGNFEMDREMGTLVCEEDPMPDMELLGLSIDLGTRAAIDGSSGYSTVNSQKENEE